MLQRTTSNDSFAAAVARLTSKERECLDRWLKHATAKEIAIDLGVTHHAVEKRLKSARAKLGVGTTLEAARLLAAAEGYGLTVYGSLEVGTPREQSDDEAGSTPLPWWQRRTSRIFTGASIMSLFVFAALVLGTQSAPQPAVANQKVVVVNRKDGTSTDLATALGGVFGKLDKNADGFIAGGELAASRFQVSRTTIAAGESAPTPTATATRIADFDSNEDGRVSETEFRDGFAKLTRPRT